MKLAGSLVKLGLFALTLTLCMVCLCTATGKRGNETPKTWMETFQALNSLEFLLPAWNYMLTNFDDFTIYSVFTTILNEGLLFGTWFLFVLLDFMPSMKKFKIQAIPNNWEMTWKCLKLVAFNHIVIQIPGLMSSHIMFPLLGYRMDVPLPTLMTICWEVMVCALLEDFYNYWVHRILHWKKIYKYIHKVHHDFAAPFGITANYAHPAEIVILGFGTYLSPLIVVRHLLTFWVYMVLRVLQAIESHSGYELPYMPMSCIPFWCGPVHHDYHHEKFNCNFAPFFTIWDFVCGTDVEFRQNQHTRYTTGKSSWSDIFYKLGLATNKKDLSDKKAKTA